MRAFKLCQLAIATAAQIMILAPASALAQTFTIDWRTVDVGGAMNTTDGVSGGFEMSGTIGQHDAAGVASPMTGGSFELVGGFWPMANVCHCPGDVNHDGKRDGRDIQQFVRCMLSGGDCSCADVDLVGGITADDATQFVADLLSGAICS